MNETWNYVLNQWENKSYPIMPKNIKNPFIWRTSVINANKDMSYKEEFIENNSLICETHDLDTYKPHFEKNKNKNKKYAINFKNFVGDTMLIIPTPRINKNYSNLFYFMINASNTQQEEFWKEVVKQIRLLLKTYTYLWISTHGLGVDYLHVRICTYPKYYENSSLKKLPNNL